jgi:prepilin-type N-terminal cleavage/methylation domain-containing protein
MPTPSQQPAPLANRRAVAPRRRPRAGFTLVELLIVVAIIGILLGLLSGAIKKTVENAKKKKIVAECISLTTAIANYRHDYNRWPHKEGEEQEADNSPDKQGNPQRLRYYTTRNWLVFNRLVAKNTAAGGNPLGKMYLDESGLTTTTGDSGQGMRIGLAKKRDGGSSTDESTLVSGIKRMGSALESEPYRVMFDLVQDTALVQYWVPKAHDSPDGDWKP